MDRRGQQEGPADALHNGVTFKGADGWIFVTRGKIEASKPELLHEPLPANAIRLYESDHHMANFFDCVRTRKDPAATAEIGHRSISVCHLGDISMRMGRKLNWDPQKQEFVNDADANKWLQPGDAQAVESGRGMKNLEGPSASHGSRWQKIHLNTVLLKGPSENLQAPGLW